MSPKTPIQDIDNKLDVIDHVNQDHSKELLAIAKSHSSQSDIVSAKILDIFQEGVYVEVEQAGQSARLEKFIPFEIDGDLEDKILYLAYSAIVKQGSSLSGNGKHFFEVTQKENITDNIVRITVKSATPLPKYYPGYAYAFLLKNIEQRPQKTKDKQGLGKRLFDRAFIWLMKHLSSKNRQKLLQNANKDVRLYTLRKSWKSSPEAEFEDMGYIDIFKHGGTAGSLWADALSTGDIIMSRSEAEDKHPHLASGQSVLIADETAFPALAGVLEHWNNPLPPYVILLSAAQAEQKYFSGDMLPEGSVLQRIVCPVDMQADKVLERLESLERIDAIWAALESDSAKRVRHYLRNTRHIVGKNNHTKAYWNLKNKR